MPVRDLPDDLLLTSGRIYGDDRPDEKELIQKVWNRLDLVRLLVRLDLPDDDSTP